MIVPLRRPEATLSKQSLVWAQPQLPGERCPALVGRGRNVVNEPRTRPETPLKAGAGGSPPTVIGFRRPVIDSAAR